MTNIKPKILFIAPFPPPLAGPEISAKLFLESNVADNFDVIKLDTNFRKSNSQKGKFGFAMMFAFFQLNIKLIKRIITFKPDIVYYYVTATMLGWLGKDIWVIMLSRLFGLKVVIHMRAGHFRKNYDQSNKVFKKIIKTVFNLTDYNLAQSPTLAKQYEGLVKDKNKIGYIYNMISEENYFVHTDDKYDENIIFFLGHLSHAKGYCDILKSIPDVVQEFPDIKFCFAGTVITEERNVFFNGVTGEPITYANPEDIFREYIQNVYEANYMYLGKLDEKQKIDWLRKSNIFILPSYSEGFSMSVLEAIAAGKPIVTTPVGALKDVLQNEVNAIIVNPGDIDAITNAILRFLRDKAFRKSVANNNKALRCDFSVDTISKKYKELFNSIL